MKEKINLSRTGLKKTCKSLKAGGMFLLFIAMLVINIEGLYSQRAAISINAQDITLQNVFDKIQQMSDYVFLVSDEAIATLNRTVEVNSENEGIEQVLTQALHNTDLSYLIVGRQISIYKAQADEVASNTGIAQVQPVQQQNNITIQGTVVDGNGEPAIGATIQIRGTTQGTITNIDGQFTLSVPQGSVLIISSIGYVTQEVAASANMRIVLQQDAELLDELVVVGYGVMRRSDLTGAIASVRGDDIARGQSFSALDGLRGRAAGVNVLGNTGQPGGEARILIRGISTIASSTNPLFVVDGVIMENLRFLNPNDIESMEVLKDASATAIYGARGANGVILVTTRRGGDTGGQAQISYSGSISIGTLARGKDMLDADTWFAAFEEGLHNANRWHNRNFNTDLSQIFTDPRFFYNGRPIYNTNWLEEATRTAISHNHQLGITYGSRNNSFGSFFNFTDQQGIALNTYMKRANARFAFDARPTRWLSVTNNLSVNRAWGNRADDGPMGQGAVRTMVEQFPWLPVRHADVFDGWYTQANSAITTAIPNTGTAGPGMQNMTFAPMSNPVEFLNRMVARLYRTQIFGNMGLTFHLTPNLQLRTQYGIEYRTNRDENFTPIEPRPLLDQNARGVSGRTQTNILMIIRKASPCKFSI